MNDYEARRNGSLWAVFNLLTGEPEPGMTDYRNRKSAEDAAGNLNDAQDAWLDVFEGKDAVRPVLNVMGGWS